MTIKNGDRVAIINKSLGGFVLEGFATVVRPENFDRWLVRFEDDGSTASRFIDLEAQGDPEQYVQRLNGVAA